MKLVEARVECKVLEGDGVTQALAEVIQSLASQAVFDAKRCFSVA
jgi:hypothetical protein